MMVVLMLVFIGKVIFIWIFRKSLTFFNIKYKDLKFLYKSSCIFIYIDGRNLYRYMDLRIFCNNL